MKIRLTFLVACSLFAATAASAQQPGANNRVNGVVKSVSGGHVIITTMKGDVDLALTEQTRYGVRHETSTGNIKPGTYLGTSNQNGAAPNTGTATEVHILPSGPNLQFPMDDKGLTMTNGRVTSVKRTDKGQEMEIDYGKDTKRQVTVTSDTSVTSQVDGTVADLKPGATVLALTDGKTTATFITVQPPAKK